MVAGSKRGNPESPASDTQKTYTHRPRPPKPKMIPSLSADSFFNFIDGTMITLFVVAMIVIFVYEYEVLRRPKKET